MKRILTILTLSFFVVLLSDVNAQFTKKGTFELGGSAGFASETPVHDGETGDATTTIYLQPMVGYFVVDNIELAVQLIFQNISYPDDESESMFAIAAAPGYVFDLHSNLYPYLHGIIGYNTSTYTPEEGDEQTHSGLLYGAEGGVHVLLGKNALLNFGVQYLMITSEPEDWDGDRVGSNQLSVQVGFTVCIGN